jgi:uncharacterized protein YqgC (DUF456 family)
MDGTILWWLLAGLIVIAGLAGTVIPALPGVPLVFAGLFLSAWIGNFETIGWITVGILARLAIAFLMIGLVIFKLGIRAGSRERVI